MTQVFLRRNQASPQLIEGSNQKIPEIILTKIIAMNETNLAMPVSYGLASQPASAKRILPKSSQSCLNCKAETRRVEAEITEAEKELSLLRLSNKAYSVQDIERKKKLELSLDDLRSLLCELETASKFEVGMWVVKNDHPTPKQVQGVYLVDSYPRVAVLDKDKQEVNYERAAQLTIVDHSNSHFKNSQRKKLRDENSFANNFRERILIPQLFSLGIFKMRIAVIDYG